jgi:hypothetical protein
MGVTNMIVELNKSQFGIISNLLDEDADNVEVKSIIEGVNPGWIFVDSLDNPQVSMVWSAGQEGFYFVGSEKIAEFNDLLNDFIDDEIEGRAKTAKLNRFEFSGETEKWCPVFEEIFHKRTLNISKQYIYKLEKRHWTNYRKRSNSSPYTLRKIDKALLTSTEIENTMFLKNEILRWWSTIDDFLNHSYGYCMMDQDTITNYSMGNFYIDNVMTIGIETLEEYRRQGLSQITSEAFVEACFKDNNTVQWECMGENIASYSLAEKMKFTRTNEYTLYSFPF